MIIDLLDGVGKLSGNFVFFTKLSGNPVSAVLDSYCLLCTCNM